MSFQIAHDIHIVGAEQVSRLCNLLHTAIQRVNAAGQEVYNATGQGLVHVFHIDDHSLAVLQVISGLGSIVEAAGAEQHNFLLVADTSVQHLAGETGGSITLEEDVTKLMQSLAEKVYRALNLEVYSRIDFRCSLR